MDETFRKILKPIDARSSRGIFSRGTAKYGVSGAPKPKNLQLAAKRRLLRSKQRFAAGKERPVIPLTKDRR